MTRPTFLLSSQDGSWSLEAVVLTERHSDSATLTEHPVETGGVVSDYVRPDPGVLSVSIAVSTQPTRYSGGTRMVAIRRPDYPTTLSQSGLLTAGAARLGAALGVSVDGFPNGLQVYAPPEGDAFVEAYDVLRRALADVEILSVITGVRYYRDMVLTSVDVARSGDKDEEIDLVFRPLVTADALTIDVPAPARTPALNGRTDLGTQAPTAVSDVAGPGGTNGGTRSILDQLLYG